MICRTSHGSAAVRTQEGISDIFDCLMGVKQGCPLSATLFGLFVDGLEQHLMDTIPEPDAKLSHSTATKWSAFDRTSTSDSNFMRPKL